MVQVDQMWSVEPKYKWIKCGVWNRSASGSNVDCETVVQVDQMWSVEPWYKWIKCGVWNHGTSGSNDRGIYSSPISVHVCKTE